MSSWMTVAIASGSSLLLHLFLLVILYLTPSPLVDEVADEGGIEDAVAQKLEEKKEDFLRMSAIQTGTWPPTIRCLPTTMLPHPSWKMNRLVLQRKPLR